MDCSEVRLQALLASGIHSAQLNKSHSSLPPPDCSDILRALMKHSSRKSHYTITEAAKELGITRAAVHRAIKQGRLEAERGEIVRTSPPTPKPGKFPK